MGGPRRASAYRWEECAPTGLGCSLGTAPLSAVGPTLLRACALCLEREGRGLAHLISWVAWP